MRKINNDFFKMTFLNHSSLLIQTSRHVILTDPFWEKPAFETWYPSPPSYLHPAYILAIAKSVERFTILISHGHDDHCDDKVLELFKGYEILITKYDSAGLRKRLEKIGFENITEISSEKIRIGDFYFNAHVDRKMSLDDSIQIITGKSFRVVHGNDCWWEMNDECLSLIPSEPDLTTIYASQIAIADAYPWGYSCFSESEIRQQASLRVKKHLISALKNADKLNAKYFLHYAGHVKIMSSDEMIKNSGFIEKDFIKSAIDESGLKFKVKLLDMLPGDSFEEETIINGIGREYYSESTIKEACADYWSKYNSMLVNKGKNILQFQRLDELTSEFITTFRSYVIESLQKKQFRQEILNSKLVITIADGNNVIKKSVTFPKYDPSSERIDLKIEWNGIIAEKILLGEINFEASYIGCLGKFSVFPTTLYNGHMIRWLSMFGYVWQKKSLNNKSILDAN
jgi:hypothetical protein